MLNENDLSRAHHEAGHAVMNWLVGASVKRISIKLTKKKGGAVYPGGPALSTQHELWTYMGGPEAQGLFNCQRGMHSVTVGWDDDEYQIERLVRILGEEIKCYDYNKIRRDNENVVRQMLSQPNVYPGLNALAEALATSLKLTGKQARQIFDNAHQCGDSRSLSSESRN